MDPGQDPYSFSTLDLMPQTKKTTHNSLNFRSSPSFAPIVSGHSTSSTPRKHFHPPLRLVKNDGNFYKDSNWVARAALTCTRQCLTKLHVDTPTRDCHSISKKGLVTTSNQVF